MNKQEFSVGLYRTFSWGTIAVLFSFLINNYLSHWLSWPGASSVFDFSNISFLGIIQAAIYVVLAAVALYYVVNTGDRGLREDSKKIYGITNYIIRACFWAVLFIGLVDMIISFIRVEEGLPALVGDDLAASLALSSFRGTYIHIPLLGLAFIIAFFHRGLGFPWLALLVVIAELLIVFSRFIFSYEHALMGDLVRFWYAALFLFASAYTLYEEGHVRVDLVYAGLSKRFKGFVNAYGSVLLGMSLCWVILAYGMGSKSTVINSPLLVFEATQQGIGMQVKYWMAGFLAIFAITMLVQFSGYFLEGMADYRGDPDDEDSSESENTPKPLGNTV